MYQSAAINLGAYCNATCGHCCFSCSPETKDTIGNEKLMKLVEKIASDEKISWIGFTGGEVFMQRKLLETLLAIVHKHGKTSTVISNGFWGNSASRIEKNFYLMDKYNVTGLTISHDEFHAPFVPTESVKNILAYSVNYPEIKIYLNMATKKNDEKNNEIIKQLGDSVLGISITKFPLLKVGSSENIDDKYFMNTVSLDNDVQLQCPGFEISYHFDGNVYPCCSPVVFDTALTLTDTELAANEVQSFGTSVEKLNSNILFYVMRKEGFRWFVDVIKQNKEFDYIDLDGNIPSVCGLCHLIFKEEETIKLLTPYLRAYYEQMV